MINGVTLSKSTTNSIRLNVAAAGSKLYIDQNGDGKLNAVQELTIK